MMQKKQDLIKKEQKLHINIPNVNPDLCIGNMKKKSILFSLDAMLAIVVSVMFMMAIYNYSENSYEPDYTIIDLYHMSADSIAVLKSSNSLSYSVTTNTTTSIYSYLRLMPSQVCLMVKIYDKSHNQLMNAAKEGCLTVPGEPAVIYESPFVADSKIYSARMISWYK
jgi:hypothetical protein